MKKNLGLDPATITLIVSLISTGIKLGYSYYQAAQYAKAQAKLTRALLDAEISSIANTLAMQTDIPFSQWFTVLKMTFVDTIPIPPPEPEPKKDWTMYVVFGVLGVLILTRR
jgi:hypothetical protein